MSELIKAEFKKLKEMSLKEKLDYIWEYYHYHIIIIAVVLAITFSLLNSLVFNPMKQIYLGIAFYGPYVVEESLDEMDVTLTDYLVDNKEDYKVYISDFYLDESNPNYLSVAIQKFYAMCSAQEIDIFIALKDQFIQIANQDFLLDLSKVEGVDFPVDEMLHTHMEDDPDTMYPFGIPLKDSEFLKSLGFNTDDLYLGVVANTKRSEESAGAISYIVSGN